VKDKNTYYYKTNSLALASALSLFCPVLEIEKSPTDKNCVFCFENTPQLHKLVSDYWNKRLSVDACEHFTQIKDLKARMYEIL